jgi:hypothetical protein
MTIWPYFQKNWIYAAALLIVVSFVAKDVIIHPGPASTPVVERSFARVARDLRSATEIPVTLASHEIRIDVRLSLIAHDTENAVEDPAEDKALKDMSGRDCAFLLATIARACRIETSDQNPFRRGAKSSFVRYVIEPKEELASR